MRVFVMGTGRCGTKTFAMACRHIENYTSGHETYARQVCVPDYPDNHIEVDPHISTILPLLIFKYPDAMFVHLVRDMEGCVESLSKRVSLVNWARFHFQAKPDDINWYDTADLYYNITVTNINLLLTHTKRYMKFHLENYLVDWRVFWDFITAVGDYRKSLAEWKVKYNAS